MYAQAQALREERSERRVEIVVRLVCMEVAAGEIIIKGNCYWHVAI